MNIFTTTTERTVSPNLTVLHSNKEFPQTRRRSPDQAPVEYLKKSIPWELWDAQVLQILVNHGLETLPSGEVPLRYDRKQESISYPDVEPHFEGALQLGRICHTHPIHLIWGTRNDLVPGFIQDSLSDPAEGRIVASVTKVENAGHLEVFRGLNYSVVDPV